MVGVRVILVGWNHLLSIASLIIWQPGILFGYTKFCTKNYGAAKYYRVNHSNISSTFNNLHPHHLRTSFSIKWCIMRWSNSSSFSSQENGNKPGVYLFYTISSLVCLYVFRGTKLEEEGKSFWPSNLKICTNALEKKWYTINKPQIYCYFPESKIIKNCTISP